MFAQFIQSTHGLLLNLKFYFKAFFIKHNVGIIKHNADFTKTQFEWLYNIASISCKPNKRIIEIKDIKVNVDQLKDLFQQNFQRHSILRIFQMT